MKLLSCCIVISSIFCAVSGNPIYVVCPSVVERSEWNASEATEVTFLQHPVKVAIICHTVTPACTSLDACKRRVKSIQRYHQREKHWGDIAYNFLIGNDGRVYEGIGWDYVGRHTKNFNDISIGIAFIGDFTAPSSNEKKLNGGKSLEYA
ncbi:peptidoglycan-recognition protein 2-like isoform X2 [Phlebotomus argentipes]|uniref:peptidoglycan-recognition protein 2-like isoform X2 n=1 Tax=Phlebotomus argentipes TaxID=94469 RepID=UPI0028929A05|nr:peptidoglycan-recognition protein 2-like isoform X2 [Phlebotomus argentipes]